MGRKIKYNDYIKIAILFMFLIGMVNIMVYNFNINGMVTVLLSGICWRVNERVSQYE